MHVYNAINRLAWTWLLSMLAYGFSVAWVVAQDTQVSRLADEQAATAIRYVVTSEAEVFAGPGEDFYPTGIVKAGQAVEVQQESADGWLAITPPVGSFSWLPAANGLLLPGGRIVEVTEKSAVSWIGSSLGTAKQYRWQVKLERGQQLSVIGERTLDDQASGSKSLWYKITPPPGEVRWIPAKATSKEPPATTDTTQAKSVMVTKGEPTSIEDESQVVQASAAQASLAGQMTRSPNRPASRKLPAHPSSDPHQHSDRWADWHAMEFKNGSFSFPGLSRMLGLPPTTPASNSVSDDPFDLTASYTRAKSRPAPTSNHAEGAEPVAKQDADISQMAVRQSRGWRDPRQLRAARQRGSGQGTFDELDGPDETMLAENESRDEPRNEPFMEDDAVMDAGFEDSGEVGSAVVTAGTTQPGSGRQPRDRSESSRSRRQSEWYGIEQAPGHLPKPPTSLTESSLEDIQAELSAMVAGPEHTWNLSPLADRARYFIEHGQNSIERGQARLLLERIESFGMIARNAAAVGLSPAPATSSRIPAMAASSSSAQPGTPASWTVPKSTTATAGGSEPSDGTGQFDATGWLVPVHSSGRDMPTHALTNDTGRIIVYVTPAPGVNLTRFESQPIGVYGLRGYLPQLKSNHIQIQRVVRLQ